MNLVTFCKKNANHIDSSICLLYLQKMSDFVIKSVCYFLMMIFSNHNLIFNVSIFDRFSRQMPNDLHNEETESELSLLPLGPGKSNSNLNLVTSTSSLKNSPSKGVKENISSGGKSSNKGKKKSNNVKDTITNSKKSVDKVIDDKHKKPSKKFSAIKSNSKSQNKTTENKSDSIQEVMSKDIKDITSPSNSSKFTNINRAKQATADMNLSQLDEAPCINELSETVQKPVVVSSTMSLSPYQNTQGIGLDSYVTNPRNLNKSTSNLNTSVCDINNVTLSSSYNNNSDGANSANVDYRKKKPVPLPRSKIPLPSEQQLELEKAKETKPKPVQRTSVASRLFWKRSKTDLGVDAVASYKSNKQSRKEGNANSGAIKYPAPKVPTFNRPLPQSSDLPVVIDVPNVKRRTSSIINDRKARDARQRLHLTSGNTISRADNANNKQLNAVSKNEPDATKPKPEIKEKPTFSTFKQQTNSNNSITKGSKSDNSTTSKQSGAKNNSSLTKKLSQSKSHTKTKNPRPSTLHDNHQSISNPGKTSISEDNEDILNGDRDENINERNSKDITTTQLDNARDDVTTPNRRHERINVNKYKNILNEKNTEEHEVTSKLKKNQKSAPLMISTEPLVTQYDIDNNDNFNDNDDTGRYVNVDPQQERMSESADKSCSTSFDSMEDSSVAHPGTRPFSNSSTSSVLSAALANVQHEMNLLSEQIAPLGSDICKIEDVQTTYAKRIDKSKEENLNKSNIQKINESKENIDTVTEIDAIQEGNIDALQDDSHVQDLPSTPEPTSNTQFSMSDSSLQIKSPFSTTSRSPPSPTSSGATPTRQVND